MAWTVEYDPEVEKDLRKLDRSIQREILDYMENRIATESDPCRFGKPLRHSKYGLWRYRVRDYRIICEIQAKRLVVLVVAVGHRRSAYEGPQEAVQGARHEAGLVEDMAMIYEYPVSFQEDHNGTVIAMAPDVPGVMTVGGNRAEALERVEGALIVVLPAPGLLANQCHRCPLA